MQNKCEGVGSCARMAPMTRARTGKTPLKLRPTSTSPSPRGVAASGPATPAAAQSLISGAAPTMPWKLVMLTATAAAPVVVLFVQMQVPGLAVKG
jgi:hypothetical protein